MSRVPEIRIRSIGDRPIDAEGDFVLYWMIANRRIDWNFSMQRAVEWARQLNRPLVVLEALRCDYRWASDRLHHFIIRGMADNSRRLAENRVCYFPYLEPERGAGRGLLAELSQRACVVVSDDFPCFFLPRMVDAAAKQIPVRFELVDSNGVLPMRAANKVFARAYDFRRFLQQNLRPHLEQLPAEHPLRGAPLATLDHLPTKITRRWKPADVERLANDPSRLADFPIDHGVGVVPNTAGGSVAANRVLQNFIEVRLRRYEDRNDPAADSASGLSPYLHFGHISSHQIFAAVTSHDDWSPEHISNKATGSSDGWWGASPSVESFLDELITWREVGYNFCSQRDDYDQYNSLPDWALETLEQHCGDRRQFTYSLDEFAQSATHDELWNAAQRQLVQDGRIHNYLRMLWGKKVLEWTAHPRDALEILIELNNRYALDGRNPNSYSGIFWCFGRYDRAWGPERSIFGKVRYMSSENTWRKIDVKNYVKRYGDQENRERRLFD